MFSFGSVKPVEKIFQVVELKLTNRYNPNKFIQIEVLVSDTITGADVPVPNAEVQNIISSRRLLLADSCERHKY